VRRSTVDAIAGARREEFRLLLEQALDDVDAWVRWKALRGIADLGIATSRALVEARTEDADFRVRLEARRARGADAGGYEAMRRPASLPNSAIRHGGQAHHFEVSGEPSE
jgi:hypothetical protein